MSDLSIATVLEYYGADLSRVREFGWSSIRCPFTENHSHNDRVKSARVSLEENAFACLACSLRGNAITLIMNRERMKYGEACEFAESILGASVPKLQQTARSSKTRKRRRRRRRDLLFD